MIISSSNAVKGTSPTIRNGVSTDQPSNITNPDFSLNYTASGTTLLVDLGTVNCSYVAIAGYNVHGGTIEIFDGNVNLLYTFNSSASGDQVIMFQFETSGTKNPRIRLTSGSGTPPTISYAAAGFYFEVPNSGEVAGYSRNWMTRQERSRIQGNLNAAPVASLTRRQALNGRLRIPNMAEIIARPDGGWGQLLKFASEEPFFINEYDRLNPVTFLPEASYICFEPKFVAPKAHSQTRQLVNASLSFKAFNGL